MQAIASRLSEVRKRIEEAARACGRAPLEVRLVAVSKRQPMAFIEAAALAGCRDFGENYVQELATKAKELGHLEGLRWHFIGHLQTNKVKAVLATSPQLIHGVDSPRLLNEIARRATCPVEVLLQVNVSGEGSKSGCAPAELGALLALSESLPKVRVSGLMTMPPVVADPELSRPFFRQLRELRDAHGGAPVLPQLSMGMSYDFEVAVQEGATLVRVGSAIFGPRP